MVFSLSAAELRALLIADRITGSVMNSSFALTAKQLTALRLFASSIGVGDRTSGRTGDVDAKRRGPDACNLVYSDRRRAADVTR